MDTSSTNPPTNVPQTPPQLQPTNPQQDINMANNQPDDDEEAQLAKQMEEEQKKYEARQRELAEKQAELKKRKLSTGATGAPATITQTSAPGLLVGPPKFQFTPGDPVGLLSQMWMNINTTFQMPESNLIEMDNLFSEIDAICLKLHNFYAYKENTLAPFNTNNVLKLIELVKTLAFTDVVCFGLGLGEYLSSSILSLQIPQSLDQLNQRTVLPLLKLLLFMRAIIAHSRNVIYFWIYNNTRVRNLLPAKIISMEALDQNSIGVNRTMDSLFGKMEYTQKQITLDESKIEWNVSSIHNILFMTVDKFVQGTGSLLANPKNNQLLEYLFGDLRSLPNTSLDGMFIFPFYLFYQESTMNVKRSLDQQQDKMSHVYNLFLPTTTNSNIDNDVMEIDKNDTGNNDVFKAPFPGMPTTATTTTTSQPIPPSTTNNETKQASPPTTPRSGQESPRSEPPTKKRSSSKKKSDKKDKKDKNKSSSGAKKKKDDKKDKKKKDKSEKSSGSESDNKKKKQKKRKRKDSEEEESSSTSSSISDSETIDERDEKKKEEEKKARKKAKKKAKKEKEERKSKKRKLQWKIKGAFRDEIRNNPNTIKFKGEKIPLNNIKFLDKIDIDGHYITLGRCFVDLMYSNNGSFVSYENPTSVSFISSSFINDSSAPISNYYIMMKMFIRTTFTLRQFSLSNCDNLNSVELGLSGELFKIMHINHPISKNISLSYLLELEHFNQFKGTKNVQDHPISRLKLHHCWKLKFFKQFGPVFKNFVKNVIIGDIIIDPDNVPNDFLNSLTPEGVKYTILMNKLLINDNNNNSQADEFVHFQIIGHLNVDRIYDGELTYPSSSNSSAGNVVNLYTGFEEFLAILYRKVNFPDLLSILKIFLARDEINFNDSNNLYTEIVTRPSFFENGQYVLGPDWYSTSVLRSTLVMNTSTTTTSSTMITSTTTTTTTGTTTVTTTLGNNGKYNDNKNYMAFISSFLRFPIQKIGIDIDDDDYAYLFGRFKLIYSKVLDIDPTHNVYAEIVIIPFDCKYRSMDQNFESFEPTPFEINEILETRINNMVDSGMDCQKPYPSLLLTDQYGHNIIIDSKKTNISKDQSPFVPTQPTPLPNVVTTTTTTTTPATSSNYITIENMTDDEFEQILPLLASEKTLFPIIKKTGTETKEKNLRIKITKLILSESEFAKIANNNANAKDTRNSFKTPKTFGDFMTTFKEIGALKEGDNKINAYAIQFFILVNSNFANMTSLVKDIGSEYNAEYNLLLERTKKYVEKYKAVLDKKVEASVTIKKNFKNLKTRDLDKNANKQQFEFIFGNKGKKDILPLNEASLYMSPAVKTTLTDWLIAPLYEYSTDLDLVQIILSGGNVKNDKKFNPNALGAKSVSQVAKPKGTALDPGKNGEISEPIKPRMIEVLYPYALWLDEKFRNTSGYLNINYNKNLNSELDANRAKLDGGNSSGNSSLLQPQTVNVTPILVPNQTQSPFSTSTVIVPPNVQFMQNIPGVSSSDILMGGLNPNAYVPPGSLFGMNIPPPPPPINSTQDQSSNLTTISTNPSALDNALLQIKRIGEILYSACRIYYNGTVQIFQIAKAKSESDDRTLPYALKTQLFEIASQVYNETKYGNEFLFKNFELIVANPTQYLVLDQTNRVYYSIVKLFYELFIKNYNKRLSASLNDNLNSTLESERINIVEFGNKFDLIAAKIQEFDSPSFNINNVDLDIFGQNYEYPYFVVVSST